jgi:uncharacterized protein YggE
MILPAALRWGNVRMIEKSTGAAVASFLLLTAPAFAEDRPLPPTVSVVGQAEEQARPDLAYVTLDIVDDRPNANDAATENARIASAVVDGLKGSGVDAKDVMTIGLSLSPVMTEQRDPKTGQIIKSTLTGYHAANVIRVRVRDIDRTGALVAARAPHGGLYQGVGFFISDRESREDALRTKAASNAMHRAALYADGAGMKLGSVRSIGAEGGSPQPRFEMSRMAVGAAPAPPPAVVEPGLITLSETVSATWDLVGR